MQITIVNESSHAVPRQFLQKWVEGLLQELGRRKVLKRKEQKLEITFVFLDKKAAQKINFEFRGKNYPTDVLSFDSLDPSSLGELVLCPDVLKRQAKEHGLSYQQELGYMVLHGVLHLLGYDHETSEADAKKMFALQDAVFETLLSR